MIQVYLGLEDGLNLMIKFVKYLKLLNKVDLSLVRVINHKWSNNLILLKL